MQKIDIHGRLFSLSLSEEVTEDVKIGAITREELVNIVNRCLDELERAPFGEPILIASKQSILVEKRVGDVHVHQLMRVMI